MSKRSLTTVTLTTIAGLLFALFICGASSQNAKQNSASSVRTVLDFGATGDGETDDTESIQRAIDSGIGDIHFPRGAYRITKPIVIDLERVGYTSISGNGTARVEMAGPGPALKFVGTHGGTASPKTVKDNVWLRQRTPLVDGIEIVGKHPQACGIEATGTMQLTLTRVVVRSALHGVHLVKRNRNVIISECHFYDNKGIGVFLDQLNLHQINIANCHISYNDGGGVVARQSEIRNLQIGTCDIEGNMGGPESEPTANVWLDATGSSIGEVAIVGCTIQHSHDAPNSANIRIDCESTQRPFTEETRHGNITIADNVLSDVHCNVDISNARAVTITGNTMWKGYTHNLLVERCANVVIASNVFDRNPRYHYGDGSGAKLGLVIEDSSDCTITGNHIHGVGDIDAAMTVRRCQRVNLTSCTIVDFGKCGLLLDEVSHSRVSDCLIRDDRPGASGISLKVTNGKNTMIVNNLLSTKPKVDRNVGVYEGNVEQ